MQVEKEPGRNARSQFDGELAEPDVSLLSLRAQHRLSCALALVLLVVSGSALAAAPSSWRGRVVGVVDGDTIDVMHEGRAERVRVASVDAPERGQPYGTSAKRCASDLCFGADVTVIPQSTDRYGRTVAEVILTNGASLGRELVRKGMAWHYTKYSDDKTLAELQRHASEKRIGLWADASPIPPWQWRTSKTEQRGSLQLRLDGFGDRPRDSWTNNFH